MKKVLWNLMGFAALAMGVEWAYGASDSQTFTVSIPKRVTITAPTPTVVKILTTSQLTGSDVVFATQTWNVKANTRTGVKVDFDTLPFNNTTHSGYKQNAKLDVALGSITGPAAWTRLSAAGPATTDFTAASPGVRISYSSNRNGNSDFVVSMTFVAPDLSVVMEGDYVTSVVGTVTENP